MLDEVIEEQPVSRKEASRRAERVLKNQISEDRVREELRQEQLKHLRLLELQGGNKEEIRRARAEILEGADQLPVDADGMVIVPPTTNESPQDKLSGIHKFMRSPGAQVAKVLMYGAAEFLPIFGGLYSLIDIVNAVEGVVGFNVTTGDKLAWDRRAVRVGVSAAPGPWAWIVPIYDSIGDVAGYAKNALSHWRRGDKVSAAGSVVDALPHVINLGKTAHKVHQASKAPPVPKA